MAIVRQIDLKHHIDEQGRIVKTGNGVPVPDNEPLILFRGRGRGRGRGRDCLAVPMLLHYWQLCIDDGCNDFQLGQIDELIAKFKTFADTHADVMKQSGITRGK